MYAIQAKHKHLKVKRTWKRDGTRNILAMQDAVANLQSNRPDLQPETCYRQLLSGETVETDHAMLRLIPPTHPVAL